MKLRDRVAVVTGSSMGIGEAIAKLFAAEGACVVVNSRSEERARKVCDQLVANGYRAVAKQADVSRKRDAIDLIDFAVAHFGGLDVLVNNAGIFMVRPSEELTEEEWRQTLDTDLSGAFFCCQAAMPNMKRTGGSIVNVSSILGMTAFPRRAAYVAAKHGLQGLTKVLAIEWAGYGIRVNALCPSYISTEKVLVAEKTSEYSPGASDITKRTPLGRYGTQDEVARAALYLASDDSSYVTGSTLTLDGGWTANGAW